MREFVSPFLALGLYYIGTIMAGWRGFERCREWSVGCVLKSAQEKTHCVTETDNRRTINQDYLAYFRQVEGLI